MEEKDVQEEMTKMPDIDLSKVKNLDAVSMTDSKFAKEFKNTVNTSSRKENKKKYCFTPPSRFKLPSGGRFYQDSADEDLRNGYASLVPMSIAEEEILTNKVYSKNGSTFRILFETCLQNDYPAKRILSYDAIYLMYALRAITYGNEYEFRVRCGNCGNEFTKTVNIEDIDFKDFSEKEDQRDIKLPISKYTITMHVSRLEDEERLVMLRNKYKDVEGVNSTVLLILTRTDKIKDDKGKELPKDEYVDFLSCLPARDRMAINKYSGGSEDMPKTTFTCEECGSDTTIEIPWEQGFLLLSE